MKIKPRDIFYCGVSMQKIGNAVPLIDEINLAHFMEYICERYRIHLKKDVNKSLAPWTSNPILQKYRFTNVFREDDRVSKALIEMVSTNEALSLEEKILNTFLFRSWNNPRTFKDLGGPWTAVQIYHGLELKEQVRPVYRMLAMKEPKRYWWNGAYNQSNIKVAWQFPQTKTLRPKTNKEAMRQEYFEPDIPLRVFHLGPWLDELSIVVRLLTSENQQKAFETIKELKGFSDFMAYQVFVDLTYIKDFPFSDNEFTFACSKCEKGLDYLFKEYNDLTNEEALFWLRDHIDGLFTLIEDNTNYKWDPQILFIDRPLHDRYLDVTTLENCCCEFSNYMEALKGTGRPSTIYKPYKG